MNEDKGEKNKVSASQAERDVYIEHYRRLGIVAVPVKPRSKHLIIPKKELRRLLGFPRCIVDNRVDAEFHRYARYQPNVAVLTGSVSGNLLVLDFDRIEDYQRLAGDLGPFGVTVKTKRGCHVWFRSRNPMPSYLIPIRGGRHIAVKGEGGYVVAPPSVHTGGVRYEFIFPANIPNEIPLIEEPLEAWLQREAKRVTTRAFTTVDSAVSRWLKGYRRYRKDAGPVKIANMTVAMPKQPEPDAPIEQWVRFYRDLGFNVIPAPTKSKMPAIKWAEFQERRATDDEVAGWLRDGSFQNIAVLCGSSSANLTVIDFDEMDAYKQSFDPKIEDETLVVRSGSGKGMHVYLRGDRSVSTFSNEQHKPKFSIRGQGAIAILPPSLHEKGNRYEIVSKHIEPMMVEQIEDSLAQLLTRLGVKDKKPLSMSEVVQGVAEGGREVNMYRLAWYLLKVRRIDERQTWNELQERNKLNVPPLSESELKHTFDSAKKAKTTKDVDKIEKVEFDVDDDLQPAPEEYDLARKILKSPHVLQIVKILLDESIRRESRNKLYAFLIILTAKHPNPKLKQILVLGGEPGGGKTTIANLLAKVVRTKKVGRFSEHAMDYSDLERYNMLYIQELLDLEQQRKMGVSSIRFLSADDQGYTIEITKGDPDGGFSTQQKKIPAMTVITTTTVANTEAQFERRIHRMNTDESKETTRAVLDWKAKEEKRAVLEWIGEVKPRRGVYILKATVDLLEPYEVSTATISETLSKVLKDTHLRARGDYNKLLALTEMLAWLHQGQRPYVTRTIDGREERLVFALPQDAYYALQIGLQPLLTMMTGLDQRLRDLLPVIGEFKNSEYFYKAGKEQETIKGFTIDQLLPRAKEVVRKPGLSKSRLREWLKILEDKGILAFTKAGRCNVYTVISDIDIQSKLGNVTDSDSVTFITTDLEKEAEIFFSSIVVNVPERGIGVTPQDWFDNDELDRDLTPLIEQIVDVEASFKLALRHRKDPTGQDLGGLEFDKSSRQTAKEGSA